MNPRILPTSEPPTIPSKLVEDFTPLLLSDRAHEPVPGLRGAGRDARRSPSS